MIRLKPDAHGILAAEDLHAADAGKSRNFILQVDDGVVGEEVGAIFSAGRVQADEEKRRRERLLNREPRRIHLAGSCDWAWETRS